MGLLGIVRRSGAGLAAGRCAALGLLLGVCAAGVSQAGKTTLVEPPGPLLPPALAGFTKVAPAPVGDGLGLIEPAKMQGMKEDGIRRYERSEYASGSAHATISAYQFMDASGAYAAFCGQLGAANAAPVKRIGDLTATVPDGTMFRSGANLVVARFDGPATRANAALEELIPKLPKVAGPAALPPLLPIYLPTKDLVAASVRYALGPSAYTAMGGILPPEILAFDKSAEAVTAAYKRRGEQGLLTLLLYPTPTIAGEEGRAIEARLREQPVSGTATMRREGPLLMLASGGFTAAEAQSLIDGIHLRNEVTWNKDMPLEFHSEVKKTASLLTSIMVFCGVGALGAILLGFFLGGARAGIRVLMGKPAASEPEFLRIDLSGPVGHGLGNEPVDHA